MTYADAFEYVKCALQQLRIPTWCLNDLVERVDRAIDIDPSGGELEYLINAIYDEWYSDLPW